MFPMAWKPSKILASSTLSVRRATNTSRSTNRRRRVERSFRSASGRSAATFRQAPTADCMLSFIVPAYNEEHELPRTLASIRHAAEAAHQPFEIIVVDDASTDATVEIARAAGALVLQSNFRQIAATRNAGARAARGDVLFFVDADTQIVPGHVSAALDCLTSGYYAGGSARIAVDREMPTWARLFIKTFCLLYFGANLGCGAFIFTRRKSFEAVGGFDEQYFAGEEVY